MKGNQMVTMNRSTVTLPNSAVVLALVMVTLAFAEDLDFTHGAETSDLSQAGVRVDVGQCCALFARLPADSDVQVPTASTTHTIAIPPQADFFGHVPKRDKHSGRLFFSSSNARESLVAKYDGLEVLHMHLRGTLKLSREYTFEQLINDIVKVNDVTSLSCPFSQMNDRHIHSVAKAFPRLKCLELGGCPITDVAVPSIANLTELRMLDLSDTAISGKNIRELSSLKALFSLSLGGCSVDDESLAALITALPNLEMIFLHGTDCGTATLDAFAAHKRLTVVDLSYTPVSDAAVAQLLRLETLKELYLNETRLSVDAFRGLSSAKNLRQLSIMGVPVDLSLRRPQDGDSTFEVWRERRDLRTEADRRLQESYKPRVE
jgi:hypothetical protein